MAKEPAALAAEVVAAVRAKFGAAAATTLGPGASLASEVTHVIASGLAPLDRWVLGVGGLPVGRLVELYGEEGTGKSTLAHTFIAGVQAEGGLAVLADTESALDPERAALFGVKLDELIVIQPDSLETVFAQAEVALDRAAKAARGKPVLFVLDSIAATPSKTEVEEGLAGEAAVADRARVLSRACRLLARRAGEWGAALLFVNQVREKIGVLFGDHKTTPGGLAVKFYSSARLSLYRGKAVKDGEGHTGMTVTVVAAKNKVSYPWRKCRLRLDYETGWNRDWSVLDHAKERGVVAQSAQGAKALAEAREKLGWT